MAERAGRLHSPEVGDPERTRDVTSRLRAAWDRYWFEGLPAERLAVFSRIVHVMVLYTVFRTDVVVADKVWAPEAFYQPTWLARVLGLPAPTHLTMDVVRLVILGSTVLAIGGLGPRRLVNGVVASSYLVFFLWAFGYAKVDHDQLTIIVALFVLTAVPGDGRGRDPMVGWALRTIQVVFVLAYPLSAVSKLRKSGFEWMSSAVFARAIVRRGSPIGDWFAAQPGLLRAGQWSFIAFEFAAAVALAPRARLRNVVLAGIVVMHLFTWLAIGISFLPHTICITAFLPLERLHPSRWRRGAGVRRDQTRGSGAGRAFRGSGSAASASNVSRIGTTFSST